MNRILVAILTATAYLVAPTVIAQQLYDPDFAPRVDVPRHAADSGPLVAIDQAHTNFHTIDGRFRPFADLLAADGYRLRANDEPFSAKTLAELDILVISNALHPSNDRNWRLPTPSAFTEAEIAAVKAWVEGGGRLLLIADHMPFPGAARDLAAAFGFDFNNGYAVDLDDFKTRFVFTADQGLSPVPGSDSQAVRRVVTFTGQAFTVPDDAISLLTLEGLYAVMLPREAGRFPPDIPFEDASGMSQGAVVEVGAGRVAVFGEAAAFSAQVGGDGNPMGMNAPDAEDNAAFVLSVMAWLSG